MLPNLLTRRNRVFPSFTDEFFNTSTNWPQTTEETRFTVPAVNITENEEGYHIIVAAPGMKKEDFQIHVSNKVLTISAETAQNAEADNANYSRREYNYSSFSRSFTIPDEVNEDKIEANYVDGILTLSLPKREEAKQPATKTIEIR